MESLGEFVIILLSGILLVLGYLFTLGLLCVPFIRLRALSNEEDGAEHLPVMYLMSLFNALAWLSFGSLDPMISSLFYINLISSITQFSYTVWFMRICRSGCLAVCTGFFLAVVLLVFVTMDSLYVLFPGMLPRGRDSYNMVVLGSSLLMYAGPIPDMIVAMWTLDPTRMSIQIVLVSSGNAFCWGEYGRLQHQDVTRMSNELGMGICLVQIVVYHVLRWNDFLVIYRVEVPHFFHETTERVSQAFQNVVQALRNGYAALRGDEEGDDDA